jgi:nucleotide-binding universal stress UspA family protein
MPGILVGVDGSDHSRLALAWALREAARQHVPLTVMTVRPTPLRPATHIYWDMPTLPEDSPNLEQAQMVAREFANKVAYEIGEKVPDITVTAVAGDPAEELVRASHDADLLVVGARGSGSFARLLLGSVSSKVTHHAGCPTVVIPDAGRAAEDPQA